MSMLKNKKLGLWLTVVVAMSLALVTILSVVAENAGQNSAYYSVNVSANNADYGSVSVSGDQNEEGKFRHGTKVTLTATPKDSRFEFEGWRMGGYELQTQNPLVVPVSGDCTYVAVFSPKKYKIHYAVEEDKPLLLMSKPEYHTHGTATLLPIPESNIAYTFVGWQAVSGDKVNEYRPGDSLGADDYQDDITLYPIFAGNKYNVTCYDVVDSEGGLQLGTVVGEHEYNANNIPLSSWEVKTYPGYTFYSEDDSKYVNIGESSYVQSYVTANTDLNKVYRIYTANTYTVMLDKNAAEAVGGDASVTVTYNQRFPTIANLPTREGYTLMGYYLDANGNGRLDYGEKMYCSYDRQADEWSYEVWDIAADDPDDQVTLVALWEKNNYTLSFSDRLSQFFAEVTVKDKLGTDYLNAEIPYNTELIIKVKFENGYKLVKTNNLSHILFLRINTFRTCRFKFFNPSLGRLYVRYNNVDIT